VRIAPFQCQFPLYIYFSLLAHRKEPKESASNILPDNPMVIAFSLNKSGKEKVGKKKPKWATF